MQQFYSFLTISIFITLFLYTINCLDSFNNHKLIKLPPCRACKVFLESLKSGLKATEKGKFEGGDAAWEEEKLGSYAKSEIRLTEIQEKLCSEIKEGKDECYNLLEKHEAEIEDWWFNKQEPNLDLFNYFCVETFKYCCPEYHFGPKCTPCDGYPNKVCNGNGKCKGDGTRKGNGKCNCDAGYTGPQCDTCADNYYMSYKDDKVLLCSKCHISCEGSCHKSGPSGCIKCKTGWIKTPDKGCVDVNECASYRSPCNEKEFCVNNEGSYRCLLCDKACGGCTGDGPDMCTYCAPGYSKYDNICINDVQNSRKNYVFLTRYLTYFGLCLATCIILNKNTMIAATIGIGVAIYIALSEYILNTPQIGDEVFQKIDN